MSEIKVGDRVKLSSLYTDNFRRCKYPDRVGVVVRLRGRTIPTADVQWEGRQSVDERINLSYLEPAPAGGAQPARKGVEHGHRKAVAG